MNQIKLTGIRTVGKYFCDSRTEFKLEQASCPVVSPSVVCEVPKLLFRNRGRDEARQQHSPTLYKLGAIQRTYNMGVFPKTKHITGIGLPG